MSQNTVLKKESPEKQNRRFFSAVEEGRISEVRLLLSTQTFASEVLNKAFCHAVRKDRLLLAKHLLEAGAEVRVLRDVSLRTAVLRGCFPMVQLLVESGASVGEGIEVAKKSPYIEIQEWLEGVFLSRKEHHQLKEMKIASPLPSRKKRI